VTPAAAESARHLPKVELHCHLEGCVRPQTFVELAHAHGVALPTADLRQVYAYTDMASFMVVFERLSSVLASRGDFARIAYEAMSDAAQSDVVYREMFFDPTAHPDRSYPDMLAGLQEGLAAAEAEHGVVGRLIPSIYRAHSAAVARDMVQQVVDHPCAEVVGIGMDGDELAGPPLQFTEAYALAGSAGLPRTAHAGERFSVAEIRDCLDVLGCTRIDHGYGIVNAPDLAQRCRDEQIHVTYAWLSTRYNYFGPLAEHPFLRMHAAGLSMSLGSDDPAIAGTDLAGDYVTVADAFGWSAEVFNAQVDAALAAAWCTEAERSRLHQRIATARCSGRQDEDL